MSDSERSGSEGTSIKEHQYAQALAGLIMDSGEDHETSGSPTPPPRSVGIEQAIDEAPAQELKKLVRRLLDLPQARPLIDAALLRPLGNGASSSNGLKRKASEVCENCHHVYQVDTNKRGMCRYHPCKLSLCHSSMFHPPLAIAYLFTSCLLLVEQEVDEESDFWADHDPDCHGDPLDDSLMNDPVYADGYIMGCCGKPPYEPGCVVSWHKPSVNPSQELSKRARR